MLRMAMATWSMLQAQAAELKLKARILRWQDHHNLCSILQST